MTEAEWLACEEPERMLGHLAVAQEHAPPALLRKLMLFGEACCLRLHDLLPKKESRRAVEMLGLRADDRADDRDLEAAAMAASRVLKSIKHEAKSHAARAAADVMQFRSMRPVFVVEHLMRWARFARRPSVGEEVQAQGRLLHCISGNPYRPPTLAPACRTAAMLSLAQAAYDERILPSGHLDPARLAVLSDALEEAGCTDADLLTHLRSPGPHVRGCWALDLVLGKG